MNDINWIDAGYKEGDTFSVYDNEYTIDSSGHINVSSGGWIYIDGNYLSTSYISIMSGSTNDPDGKIARENAEKKAKENREKEEKIKEKRAAKREEEKNLAAKRAENKINVQGDKSVDIGEDKLKTFNEAINIGSNFNSYS